jgi:hypothetical protein
MRTDRSASFLLTLVVGVSLTFPGCGSGGDGEMVKMAPEAEKKVQDMLGGMQKKMQDMHKAQGKGANRGR